MLAGEGDAIGVSNTDPYATEPTADNDWVKEGPHLMILMPDPTALEGLSTDPADPVYVMWKGTPYAHIMVRIAAEDVVSIRAGSGASASDAGSIVSSLVERLWASRQ